MFSIVDLPCTCNDFVNKNRHGNCQGNKSKHRSRQNTVVCYVDQPSGCRDLVHSKTNPGMKMSAEACDEKGS